MSWLLDPNIWIALLTLSALEIVLGIDNIIFIAMAFSTFVEILNMRLSRRKPEPVRLRNPRSAKLS